MKYSPCSTADSCINTSFLILHSSSIAGSLRGKRLVQILHDAKNDLLKSHRYDEMLDPVQSPREMEEPNNKTAVLLACACFPTDHHPDRWHTQHWRLRLWTAARSVCAQKPLFFLFWGAALYKTASLPPPPTSRVLLQYLLNHFLRFHFYPVLVAFFKTTFFTCSKRHGWDVIPDFSSKAIFLFWSVSLAHRVVFPRIWAFSDSWGTGFIDVASWGHVHLSFS